MESQADNKLPFPNTAFPQHQPVPAVAPCPQTPVGTQVRGTAAPDCAGIQGWGAGALSHLINERERSKELLPWVFGNSWAGYGKQSRGNLPLDQLEAHGALFHE